MYVRFKSIEAISALRMAVRGEYDDAADMDMDGGGTSVDALMIMQGEQAPSVCGRRFRGVVMHLR